MKVLVTGGAGYIGSHTVVELINAGHDVVVVDNLSNASERILHRMEDLAGKRIPFYAGDIRERNGLDRMMAEHRFDACIHFAGAKVVGESVRKPLECYSNNVAGTVSLLESLKENGCKNIIFSSTAAVYGDTDQVPVPEGCPTRGGKTPYSRTKYMIEEILGDLHQSDPSWNIVILRYFNPVGAHPSGRIGEAPSGTPNNLMPYITQVAVGRQPYLNVFGDDYDTPDGTGIRDYIHVMDLASGHVKALERLQENCGMEVYNLGTGTGYSVLDLVNTFRKVTGAEIPCVIQPRRLGDIAISYADVTKAQRELGWTARYTLEDMCRDAWNWQKNNPYGFEE